jgi:pimeloyl-ACP methyl ester carboxylesterase
MVRREAGQRQAEGSARDRLLEGLPVQERRLEVAGVAYTLSRARVPHVKRTMRHLIGTCTKQVPDDELRRIGVPTALLWGRHDRFVPLRLAEDAASRLGWPLHVLDASGHVPHIERPDAFLDALARAGAV